jgi:hypothetical protein
MVFPYKLKVCLNDKINKAIFFAYHETVAFLVKKKLDLQIAMPNSSLQPKVPHSDHKTTC